MPITVRAVSEKEFEAWLVQAKTKFSADAAPVERQRHAAADRREYRGPAHWGSALTARPVRKETIRCR